jgi:hypothetical protein
LRAAATLEAQANRAPVEPLVAAVVTALDALGERAPREPIRAALHDEERGYAQRRSPRLAGWMRSPRCRSSCKH